MKQEKQQGKNHKIKKKDLLLWHQNLKEKNRSKATIEKYQRDMKMFVEFLSGDWTVNEERVREWREELMKVYQPRSINANVAALKNFFAFMGWNDLTIDRCEIEPENEDQEGKRLTREDYQLLCKAAENKPRLHCLIETIVWTGVRVFELEAFTVEALEEGKVVLKIGKTTKTVIIPDRLEAELYRYILEENIESGCIFRTKSGKPVDRSNVWRGIRMLCKEAGISEEKGSSENLRKLGENLKAQRLKTLEL